MRKYQMFVGGRWLDPASGSWIESYDPYLGKPWALIPRCDSTDVDNAVAAARYAFCEGDWARLKPSARGEVLRRIGDVLSARAEELAKTEVRDNGKRLVEVLPQLKYLPQYFYYFGGLADKIEGAVIPIDLPDSFNYTRHEPLGVIAAITPWNSPIMLATWKLAPALAAGNTIVLKPSEHASASTLEFMQLLQDAGLPPGTVNVVTGYGNEVGEALVRHPDVAKVSFTGSAIGGRRVAQMAAADVKPVTLELGGKSPQIVFDDADFDNAVHAVCGGIFVSLGQSCVAGSRLLLQEGIHDRFLDRLISIMSGARMGNPVDRNTQIGPIATRPQYEKVLEYVELAKNEGAICVLGGKPTHLPECGQGWFVEPTIFKNVTNRMRLAREEVFGPVLAVMRFRNEAEAVAIANDSRQGLAAGVWTSNMNRGIRLAERIQAGTVYVNTYRNVSAMSPAGGFKQSGYGRENGIEAIREFMQTKSVWLGLAERIPNPFAPASR